MPSRQKAFRSPSEEYAKILDVVGRYAVHCTGVAFSCKKHGDSSLSLSTSKDASTADCIRQIHGSAIANELIPFEVTDETWGFTASGYTTNANYHVKKTTILLFINHRSVQSSAIKKALEQTYSTFLPKGGHPFAYLSLDIDPQRVDVNVHPTKREVNFLNEEEIIEAICTEIRVQLSKVDTSRTFMTQSLLPGSVGPGPKVPVSSLNPRTPAQKPSSTTRNPTSTPRKPSENNLVRTDPSLRKITSMLPPSTHPSSTKPPLQQPTYLSNPRAPTNCRLTTVKELRAAVRDSMHATLTEVFATHTYIGLVDSQRRIVAIQGGVKLFLVDYGLIAQEYFYQLGLTDFGNFGALRFDPPLSIPDLIRIGLETERAENPNTDIEWDQVPEIVTQQLISRREMLLEYYSFDISSEGDLISLPLLTKGYTPSMTKLPRFLMRLGPCVNWDEEKACFHTFLRELASFYTPEQLPNFWSDSGDKGEAAVAGREEDHGRGAIRQRREEVAKVLEHVLFPAFRARLVATRELLSGVVEVADLKGLYRVFERC